VGRWTKASTADKGPQVPCKAITKARADLTPPHPCTGRSWPGEDFCWKHLPGDRKKALGLEKRFCTAVSKRTGKPCGLPPVKGQLVCRRHGGAAPQAQHAAAVWVANKEAQKVLAQMGAIAPVDNALEALQKLAGEVLAWKDACATFVAALDPSQYRYASQFELEQIRGEVLIWQDAMKTAVETLTKLARVQVDERLAAIEEAKVAILTAAFAGALTGAGLPDEQAGVVRADFTRRLRALPVIPRAS
jgi:hypothetical protein